MRRYGPGPRVMDDALAVEVFKAAHVFKTRYPALARKYGVSVEMVGELALGLAFGWLFKRETQDDGSFYIGEDKPDAAMYQVTVSERDQRTGKPTVYRTAAVSPIRVGVDLTGYV